MQGSIEAVLHKYWGFDDFLPLQKQAIECICRGHDSIVVLPTGGGKSLCFQAPALILPHLTLVISPLISLMKDQIDSLLESGIPAGRLDSTMSHPERNEMYDRLRARRLKLLYVSPERLLMRGFLDFLKNGGISSVAIDEAHCVSMWGHDFRPEYRKLSILREALPGIPIGAYTATATEHVLHYRCVQNLYLKPQFHRKITRISINRQGRMSEVYISCPYRKLMRQLLGRIHNRQAAYATYPFPESPRFPGK